ncbi:hypothetical protein IWW34DRAFT_621180 [Fusarium oxysporum f. sp. albedinis]|nr:hypothetical protein IWW34DRAFT_621180 [Fusarium oxysporum f. sp. albedinis]
MDFAQIYFLAVTGLKISLLILFLAANGFLLGVGISDLAELEQRTAVIASANLMLVFLGGRTNALADFVQIPLSTYYVGHRWIGVVATCEALLHSALALFRRQKFDALTKSGYVQEGKARIPIFVSCGLLGGSHLYRWAWMFILGHTAGTVKNLWDDGNIMRLQLGTDKPVTVFPGCYFYLFFTGPLPFYDLFHGYAMMPVWSNPDQYVTGQASDLTFLISRTIGHHRRSLGSIFPESRLRLDGPYGKDLKLHTFETVVLTAKGLGISGILPFALHLAARKRHDNGLRDKSARLRDSSEPVFGDLSRHVDLIWWLEHDDQDRWVHDQLQSLQEVDNKACLTRSLSQLIANSQKFLIVWCIYPVKRNPERKLPFTSNEYWSRRYNFGFDEFSRELRQEARYPGRTVVVASGEEKFVSMMRDMVVQNTTSKRLIEFADVEYHTQPGGFKSSFYNPPDSQAVLVNSNTPSDSQSTPIEMTEMDISDQHVTFRPHYSGQFQCGGSAKYTNLAGCVQHLYLEEFGERVTATATS